MRPAAVPAIVHTPGIVAAFVSRSTEVEVHRRSVRSMRRGLRCLFISACLVALAGACLGLPATAAATTISTDPVTGGFLISGDAGESNAMTVSAEAGELIFEDPNASLTASPELFCPTQEEHEVRCSSLGFIALTARLGDRDDTLRVADSAFAGTILLANLSGEAGNDTLVAGAPSLVLFGGDGNDELDGRGNGDGVLVGGPGADEIQGGPAKDEITGNDGDDRVFAGPGADNVKGDEGNDELHGGPDADAMFGGAGADTLTGDEGPDRLDNPTPAEVVDDPSLTGGRDSISGGPGDDQLGGGSEGAPMQADSLSGNDGRDTVDYSSRVSPVVVSLDGSPNDGASGEGDNVNPDIENIVATPSGDTLIGSDAVNVLDGRGGPDVILGLGGDDTLQGGVNDPSGDTLIGGTGNDTMQGESGDDALKGGDGADSAFGSGGSDRVEGEAGNDSVSGGPGGDTVDGGEGDDKVNGSDVAAIGGDGDDRLFGGPGSDDLRGGRGNDELDGGLGADTMDGEGETDTVTYKDRTHEVFVSLDGLDNDGEANEHDNVVNVERIVGGRLGDTLSGDAGNNTIAGERGQDLILGKLGIDRLQGGAAGDVVMARDGVADVVECGAGSDLAIADRQDKVSKCNTVDVPRRRHLIVGRYALVRPRGRFGLRLPHGSRFFPLGGTLKIPIGAAVDPRAGVVGLATARNRAGARRFVSVSEGRFIVRQKRSRQPVTRLRLAGRLPQCRASSSRLATATRTTRSLRVSGEKHRRSKSRRSKRQKPGNKVEVLGKYSKGSSDGTEWITEDRCDGTLTTVLSGTVRVRDYGRAKTVTVRAGHKHLARP
jgi:Ca2+-binding RTX toxin-like protein